jgi:hypothetical protein
MADTQTDHRPDSTFPEEAERNVQSGRFRGRFFEIRVKGHLSNKWTDWLEGLDVKLLDNGEMILSGLIADQAALMGVLNKVNRLNLTLLSVSQGQPEAGDPSQPTESQEA